jgi:hypothetical protein
LLYSECYAVYNNIYMVSTTFSVRGMGKITIGDIDIWGEGHFLPFSIFGRLIRMMMIDDS